MAATISTLNQFRKQEIRKMVDSMSKLTVKDIIKIYPKSSLATNSGIHPNVMASRFLDPASFRVSEIKLLAKHLELLDQEVYKIISNSIKK